MIKKITYINLVVIALFFTSCNNSAEKMSISNKADFEKVKNLMVEKMGDIDYITLSFNTDNPERCIFEQVTAFNKSKMIFYSTLINDINTSEASLSEEEKKLKPVKVSNFNVDEFIEIKGKAINMIEEKSKNFADYKIESLRVTKTPQGGNEYYFKIIAVKQNQEISYIGRKINPNKAFYEFSFSYNTDTQKLSSNTKGLNK